MADQERTEDPRPRQLEEAREKGMIPTSMEVNTAFVVLIGFLILRFFSGTMLYGLEQLATETWRRMAHPEFSVTLLQRGFLELGLRMVLILGPIALGVMLVGLAVNFAQVGPLLSFKIIAPDFSRLDPTKGFKQLFSRQGLMEALKSIAKMVLIGYVAYLTIWAEIHSLDILNLLDPKALLRYTGQVAFRVGWRVALVMLVIAGFDYAYQRWQHKQDMKITRQEAKQADKDYDLDPNLKRYLREKQVEMATRRMMQEVPKADVVVVNPEHVAVALRYERGAMPVPMVVAKGVDRIALRIKQIAEENDVPVIEDKPLAWALYESVEIGMFIPEDLILAVAAIFRRVYQQKGLL